MGAIALVGILVVILLLPSPISVHRSATGRTPDRNDTLPANVTYDLFYPPAESASLQGSLENATWSNIELASSIFVPYPVRECSIATPAWFAPCVAKRAGFKGLYGEELVYPDFGLPLPVFAKGEQRTLWLKAAEKVERMRYEKRDKEEYMLYRGQHGQNYVRYNSYRIRAAGRKGWHADSRL